MVRVEEASRLAGELLAERGWRAEERRFVQLAFTHPVRREFAAGVELSVAYEDKDRRVAESFGGFVRAVAGEAAKAAAARTARAVTRDHWPRRPPVVVSERIALECLPATRMLRALTADGERRVRVGAWMLSRGRRDAKTAGFVKIAEDAELLPKVKALAAGIDRQAVGLARAWGTRAGFIEQLREQADERLAEELVAALVAYDYAGDAREVLDGMGENATLERRRFVRQALRVLDAEVSLEELEQTIGETGPVGFGIAWSAFRGAWSERKHTARSAEAALAMVRALGTAATRDERRALLKAELATRGLKSSPSGIEMELDKLEQGYKQKRISTVGALREAIRSVRKYMREPRAPDPPWLQRPEAATYKLGSGGPQAGVELDSGIEEWLERVNAAATRSYAAAKLGLSTAYVDVWFSRAAGDSPRIVVSIGEQRVGLVETDATAVVSAATTHAELREELAWTVGSLTRRAIEPRYVLEFRTPTEMSASRAPGGPDAKQPEREDRASDERAEP